MKDIFSRLALYYDLLGEDYKARAFLNFASIVSNQVIADVLAGKKIKGVSKGISDRIKIITETGSLPELHDLEKDKKIKAMLLFESVPGIGPKTAQQLVKSGIMTITALKADKDLYSSLTSMQKVGLKYMSRIMPRIPRDIVTEISEHIKQRLSKIVDKFVVAGSYRRGAKDSGDIDILVTLNKESQKTIKSAKDILDTIKDDDRFVELFSCGPEKMSFLFRTLTKSVTKSATKSTKSATKSVTKSGTKKDLVQVDIFLCSNEEFVAHLLYSTGSWNHNVIMRTLAMSRGYKLNQRGLFTVDGKNVPLKDEKELYRVLNTKYIPPEERI